MTGADPYKPPHSSEPDTATPIQFGSRHHMWMLAACTTFVSFSVLAQYLALDFFVVRLRPYPAEANHYDEGLFLFPLLPLITLIVASQVSRHNISATTILIAMAVGLVCSVPLMLTLGIWFHFAIGGKL